MEYRRVLLALAAGAAGNIPVMSLDHVEGLVRSGFLENLLDFAVTVDPKVAAAELERVVPSLFDNARVRLA